MDDPGRWPRGSRGDERWRKESDEEVLCPLTKLPSVDEVEEASESAEGKFGVCGGLATSSMLPNWATLGG